MSSPKESVPPGPAGDGSGTEGSRTVRARRLAILLGTAATSLVILVVFREIIVPFVIAVVLSYVLYPAVEWIHRRHIGRFAPPRWLAVVVLYAALIGLLSVFGTTLAPQLGRETSALIRNAPDFFAHVRREWVPAVERAARSYFGPLVATRPGAVPGRPAAEETPPPTIRVSPTEGGGFEVALTGEELVVERVDEGRYRIGPPRPAGGGPPGGLQRQIDDAVDRTLAQGELHAMTALRWTQHAVFVTVEVVFQTVLSLMLAGFILATSPAVMAFFRSLFPPRLRKDFDQLVRRVDRGLSGVIRGQLIICLVNGVLSGVGFAIAGLPYWPLLAVLAAVASLVPIFGTIASSIPAVALGLSDGWGTGIFVLIWIVAIHELEANVLNPKIMGDAAKMHPVLVVFALLAGANAAGTLGALLGVPVMSIIQSLFRFLRSRAYEEDECADPVEPADCEGRPPAGQGAP